MYWSDVLRCSLFYFVPIFRIHHCWGNNGRLVNIAALLLAVESREHVKTSPFFQGSEIEENRMPVQCCKQVVVATLSPWWQKRCAWVEPRKKMFTWVKCLWSQKVNWNFLSFYISLQFWCTTLESCHINLPCLSCLQNTGKYHFWKLEISWNGVAISKSQLWSEYLSNMTPFCRSFLWHECQFLK